MPKYRVLLVNGIVLDVRDPREHAELVAEWVGAVEAGNSYDKAMGKEEDLGIDNNDERPSLNTTLMHFAGEEVNGQQYVGAASLHSSAITAIGVPETLKTTEKTFQETIEGFIKVWKMTPPLKVEEEVEETSDE